MVINILRLILLVVIPIETVISVIWFMEREPFEEIVRTGFAVLVGVVLVAGWIITLRDFIGG